MPNLGILSAFMPITQRGALAPIMQSPAALQLPPDIVEKAQKEQQQSYQESNAPSAALLEAQAQPVSIPSFGMAPQSVGAPKRKGPNYALLSLSAGLLGGRNFWDGLSTGISNFTAVKKQEEEDAKLKTKLAADGAFLTTTDPRTGQMQFQRTPIADYVQQNNEAKWTAQEDVWRQRLEAQRDIASDNIDSRLQIADEDRMARQQIAAASNSRALQVANITAASRERVAQSAAQARSQGMKPAELKMYLEKEDQVTQSGIAIDQLNPVLQDIASGKLKLGLANNAYHMAALNGLAPPTKNTQRYGQFKQSLESLRNATLLLNKGVQTDGDADRAMNELLSGKGDNAAVTKNLQTVMASIKRRQAVALQQMQRIEGNSSAAPASANGWTITRVK